jgi:hypothetical protein
VELEPEEALTIADLPDDAPLRRWPGGPIYPNLVQSSGSELSAEHGAFLVATLSAWSRSPTHRSLTPKQIAHAPRPHKRDSSLGPVTIPDDDTVDEQTTDVTGGSVGETVAVDVAVEAELAVTDHSVLQAKLLELGRLLGLTPWVNVGDQSRPCRPDGTTLGQLPGVTTVLRRQFDDATTDTIRRIDVMWLYRSRIDAAFEVEHTTAIYSGILRMADLLALQPNIDIPPYVVVPDDRRDKALQQIDRPRVPPDDASAAGLMRRAHRQRDRGAARQRPQVQKLAQD